MNCWHLLLLLTGGCVYSIKHLPHCHVPVFLDITATSFFVDLSYLNHVTQQKYILHKRFTGTLLDSCWTIKKNTYKNHWCVSMSSPWRNVIGWPRLGGDRLVYVLHLPQLWRSFPAKSVPEIRQNYCCLNVHMVTNML